MECKYQKKMLLTGIAIKGDERCHETFPIKRGLGRIAIRPYGLLLKWNANIKKMLLTGIAIKGVKDVMKPSPLKGD